MKDFIEFFFSLNAALIFMCGLASTLIWEYIDRPKKKRRPESSDSSSKKDSDPFELIS